MQKHSVLLKAVLFTFSAFAMLPTHAQNKPTDSPKQGIIKDIPRDKGGVPYRYYGKKRELEKLLGLSTLEKGYDSLQIRVWYGSSFINSLQLLILTRSHDSWSAEYDSISLHYNKKGDSLLTATKHTESKSPSSGWRYLTNTLSRLGIYTLPDASRLPHYPEANDGYGITIEYATKKKYRIYNYTTFEGLQYTETKKISKILKLLETQFNFQRIGGTSSQR